jgi:S1-C subfamily serine protease
VTDGTPAQSLGFLRGDLVISVNNQKIAKTRDLERATSQSSRVWRITIMRGGQQMSVVLSG